MQGELTRILAGNRIKALLHNDSELQIVMDNGQSIVVVWRDKDGQIVPGGPALERIDVKVELPPVAIFAEAGNF